jgi:hypothetical protein
MRIPTAFRAFAAARNLNMVAGDDGNLSRSAYLYSTDGTRRYAYGEVWNPSATTVLWVMTNPGTGETEQRRRYTLERCRAWSRSWGHGGLLFGNITSRRTKLVRHLSPQDFEAEPVNLQALCMLRSLAQEVIVAWGNSARDSSALSAALPLLNEAMCLGVTKRLQPRHPLYVSRSTERVRWNAPR